MQSELSEFVSGFSKFSRVTHELKNLQDQFLNMTTTCEHIMQIKIQKHFLMSLHTFSNKCRMTELNTGTELW